MQRIPKEFEIPFFPMENSSFATHFHWQVLKIQGIEYFIRYINFKMWLSLFYANFLYYQQWNSNWDIAFFNSSLDLKLGFLNVGFRLYFKFFPYSQKDWKLGFVNITLVGLLNFFEFMKEMDYWDFWMLT